MPYFLFINKVLSRDKTNSDRTGDTNYEVFLVEGNIIDAGRMTDDIMKEHMAYTGAAMERGMTFMSGL